PRSVAFFLDVSQKKYDLPQLIDSLLGSNDIAAALNTSLSRRVEQIQLSLERWRWLPTEFETMPVVVNIPEFQGFEGRQTPVFAETMKTVVFRPYWNVPPSIQKNEIEPKAAKDPAYLSR